MSTGSGLFGTCLNPKNLKPSTGCVLAQSTRYGYLLTSVCAAAWAPLIGFILLERKHSFSVSQWGPALMGFTDATRYLVLFLAFLALYLGMARTQAGEFLVNARVYQARWRVSGVRA